MYLSSKKIETLIRSSLFKTNEEYVVASKEGKTKQVDGIVRTFIFDSEKLEKNKPYIELLIDQLPQEFKDGWSFLNLCVDKNGRQWTDFHETMEELFLLGIAIDKMEYTMPKYLWNKLPGGMPYITIKS